MITEVTLKKMLHVKYSIVDVCINAYIKNYAKLRQHFAERRSNDTPHQISLKRSEPALRFICAKLMPVVRLYTTSALCISVKLLWITVLLFEQLLRITIIVAEQMFFLDYLNIFGIRVSNCILQSPVCFYWIRYNIQDYMSICGDDWGSLSRY